MKFTSDIDIDFANRDLALAHLRHHPAGIQRDGKLIRHNTGIYATRIPTDPFTGVASIDHHDAEDRGYIKLDFLNVSLYQRVQSEQHLDQLMAQEPAWDRLYDPEFCAQLIHINAHYDTLIRMPEAVNSMVRMAMFLAVIRPAKRHLIGEKWANVAKTVWDRPADDGYYFKKSHAVAYAHLVVVNMNLLTNATEPASPG
jgi:hypothetical protein